MKVEDKVYPAFYPNPAVLVTCKHGEEESIITISWGGTAASDPPQVFISIQPKRFSHHIIKESGEFVINFPTIDQLGAVKLCGTKSGRQLDKWQSCSFTKEVASKVNVPMIAECPANMECTVEQIISLGSHDMFIAKVVAVHLDQEWKARQYEGALTYARGVYSVCGRIDPKIA